MKKIIFLAFFCSACSEGIPVFGINGKGEVQELAVDQEIYSQEIGKLVQGLHQKTLPILENKSKSLQLTTIAVGVGIVAQAGIGPLKVSAEPRMRFLISNRDTPTIP